MIEGQKVILAKPQTYMNLSGESVRSLLDYYKVDEEQELLVIYDDISLGVGQIRIRKKKRWTTMFIIVGLGNPTPEYEGTRHNVGFEVIDALARKYNIDVDMKKHRAYIGK